MSAESEPTPSTSSPLSLRLPIARLELYSAKTSSAVTDELDATSKALLVEFSWSDLNPLPPPGQRTVYTLEWDEKPILLPTLDDEAWAWDAPIEVPAEIVFDGREDVKEVKEGEEETVLCLVLIPGTEPHIPTIYLRPKPNAIAPAEADVVNKESSARDLTAPLEISVKTLSPTYPLSSEFLGANYRYIADLIMREVATAPAETKTKGILHTVFAVRRLEELVRLPSTKQTKEEKAWIEKEFGITLERLNPGGATMSDEISSPTATAAEWTSQLDLATIDTGADEGEMKPWPKPNLKAVHPEPDTPHTAISISGLGLTTAFTKAFDSLTGKSEGKKEKEGESEDEEDLFQLPLSPRSPIEGDGAAFAALKGTKT